MEINESNGFYICNNSVIKNVFNLRRKGNYVYLVSNEGSLSTYTNQSMIENIAQVSNCGTNEQFTITDVNKNTVSKIIEGKEYMIRNEKGPLLFETETGDFINVVKFCITSNNPNISNNQFSSDANDPTLGRKNMNINIEPSNNNNPNIGRINGIQVNQINNINTINSDILIAILAIAIVGIFIILIVFIIMLFVKKD